MAGNLYEVRQNLRLYYTAISDALTKVPWWQFIRKNQLKGCEILMLVLLDEVSGMIFDAQREREAAKEDW